MKTRTEIACEIIDLIQNNSELIPIESHSTDKKQAFVIALKNNSFLTVLETINSLMLEAENLSK